MTETADCVVKGALLEMMASGRARWRRIWSWRRSLTSSRPKALDAGRGLVRGGVGHDFPQETAETYIRIMVLYSTVVANRYRLNRSIII